MSIAQRCKTGVLIVGTILLAVWIWGESASAIPAFARKYNMSCTTCHAPFPKLKAYGDEFAGNGFVLKDQDAPRYFVETGDQRLSLIRDLPVAVRFEGYLGYHSVPNDRVDFTSPYNVKLLSGGSVTRDIAYYFYFFFSERGEVAGIEDAFIMFNDIASSELDIYVGQFQVSDPLFKRELRLTFEDYQIYRVKPGYSSIGLTYDRGIMLTYGFPTGTDVVVEVLNGNGIGEADDNRLYDNDKYKTALGRVSQDIGDHFRVGAFGYIGKEGEGGASSNEVWLAGPDASLSFGQFSLDVQYVERRDDNPLFEAMPSSEIETRGGFAELLWWPEGDKSTWYAAGLYNKVESDYPGLGYESVAAHVGYLLRTNVRLSAELLYDIQFEETKILLGFVTGF